MDIQAVAREQTRMFRYACPHCASEQVGRDANAVWSELDQRWELGTTFDSGWCGCCGAQDLDLVKVVIAGQPAASRDGHVEADDEHVVLTIRESRVRAQLVEIAQCDADFGHASRPDISDAEIKAACEEAVLTVDYTDVRDEIEFKIAIHLAESCSSTPGVDPTGETVPTLPANADS